MSNILNTIITNQELNQTPEEKRTLTSFSYDTAGRVKPLADKATLLPSRIIGSPVEYAKDLKKDIISIGKAVKGQANDHELGRINSLAMKLGSLGIAGYLFAKNPLKLSKTMEFAGFGAFFGSMAIWPKLAIQFPLKLRTGVDFQQEYIDSQGRKKLLYQDPQYVLTDLLPRKDLDKIGDKMGVDKNLPDRDNFIKQRAHKAALQANTLWMTTAGFATPIMAALISNRAEKILDPYIESRDLKNTHEALFSRRFNEQSLLKSQDSAVKEFEKFLNSNADNVLDDKMIEKIADEFTPFTEKLCINEETNGNISKELMKNLKEELKVLSKTQINGESYESILKTAFGDDILAQLTDENKLNLKNAASQINVTPEQKLKEFAEILHQSNATLKVNGQDVPIGRFKAAQIESRLGKSIVTQTVGDVHDVIKDVYRSFVIFDNDKKLLYNYIDARIGNRSGSFEANQWGRFFNKVLDSLNLDNPFTTKELKRIKDGDTKFVEQKLGEFVSSENFNKTVADLMKMIKRYDVITTADDSFGSEGMLYNIRKQTIEDTQKYVIENGKAPVSQRIPQPAAHTMFESMRSRLASALGEDSNLAEMFIHRIKPGTIGNNAVKQNEVSAKGTVHNTIVKDAEYKILGTKSSLYRQIMILDVFKQAEDGTLNDRLIKNFKEITGNENVDKNVIDRLKGACKDVVLRATSTHHIEKLTAGGFEKSITSDLEYKVVMKTLFGDNGKSAIEAALGRISKEAGLSDIDIQNMIADFNKYKQDFLKYIVNWKNGNRPDLARRVLEKITEAESSRNGTIRNNIVGKPVTEAIVDFAKSNYNSKKWLVMFSGAMAALTGITLGAGLLLGRKSDMEKYAEAESRKNV